MAERAPHALEALALRQALAIAASAGAAVAVHLWPVRGEGRS
ncbi:hypothetical protein ACWC5C_03080 [Streptomyces sp. NPDC001700]